MWWMEEHVGMCEFLIGLWKEGGFCNMLCWGCCENVKCLWLFSHFCSILTFLLLHCLPCSFCFGFGFFFNFNFDFTWVLVFVFHFPALSPSLFPYTFPFPRSGCSCGIQPARRGSAASFPATSVTLLWLSLSLTLQVGIEPQCLQGPCF